MAIHIAKDSRLIAKQYCEENGITAQNTVFDGYTPFAMEAPLKLVRKLQLNDDNSLMLLEERDAGEVSYITLISGMFDRVYAQPEQYPERYALYEHI